MIDLTILTNMTIGREDREMAKKTNIEGGHKAEIERMP